MQECDGYYRCLDTLMASLFVSQLGLDNNIVVIATYTANVPYAWFIWQ